MRRCSMSSRRPRSDIRKLTTACTLPRSWGSKPKRKVKNKTRVKRQPEPSSMISPKFKTPDIRKDKHFRIVHKASTIKTTKWIQSSEKLKQDLSEYTKFNDGAYLKTPENYAKTSSWAKESVGLHAGQPVFQGKQVQLLENPYSNNLVMSQNAIRCVNEDVTTLVWIGSGSKIVKPTILHSCYNTKSGQSGEKPKELVKIKAEYWKSQELATVPMSHLTVDSNMESPAKPPVLLKDFPTPNSAGTGKASKASPSKSVQNKNAVK